MNLLSLVSFFNFTGFSAFIVYYLRSGNRSAETWTLILINTSLALWSFTYTFFYSAGSMHAAWFWHKLSVPGWCTLPAFSLYYYFRTSHTVARIAKVWRLLIFAAVPALMVTANSIAQNTSVAENLVRSSSGWGWTYTNSLSSTLFWIYAAYIFLYFSAGFFYLYRWSRTVMVKAMQKQAVFMILVSGAVLFFGILSDLILPLCCHYFPPVAVLLLSAVLYGGLRISTRYTFFMVSDETKSDLVLETIMDAVMLMTPEGTIIRVNRAATELLHSTEKKLDNTSVRGFFVDQTALNRGLAMLMSELSVRNRETVIRTVDGKLVPVVVSASLAEDSVHGFLGIVISFHDILLRKQMENSLRESREKYKKLADDYYVLANYDALTGLPNRRLFFQKLYQLQAAFGVYGKSFALIYMDLNGFKEVNDGYGHDTGDRLLVDTAHRMQTCMDTDDVLARMGGDEFVLLIPDSDSGKAAGRIRLIKSRFDEPIVIDGTVHMISIAAGFSVYARRNDNINELLRIADQAMYADKGNKGRAAFGYIRIRTDPPEKRIQDPPQPLSPGLEKNETVLG